VLKTYSELDTDRLSVQLAVFKMNNQYSTLAKAKPAVQAMQAAMRPMFSEVEKVIRLLLCVICLPAG
jgi:hypothetical protein